MSNIWTFALWQPKKIGKFWKFEIFREIIYIYIYIYMKKIHQNLKTIKFKNKEKCAQEMLNLDLGTLI
jgi:hypothetical protein